MLFSSITGDSLVAKNFTQVDTYFDFNLSMILEIEVSLTRFSYETWIKVYLVSLQVSV